MVSASVHLCSHGELAVPSAHHGRSRASGFGPTRSRRAFPPTRVPVPSCTPSGFSHQRLRCGAADDDELHETRLGPEVLASVAEVRANASWAKATVVRNDGVALDGKQRVLHLTIDDNVGLMYGRKFEGRQSGTKWIDSYTLPGQSVSIRPVSEAGAEGDAASNDPGKLYHIASSPYQSRSDSAYLDSSLIEVAVSGQGDERDQRLAALGPGAQVEVSGVVGRGFSSLLSSYAGLPSSLEEQRPLLLLGVGLSGMAPLRAALNWTPLQAHASTHPVAALYVADTQASAAFLTEWDLWREAGVNFRPLYVQDKLEATTAAMSADPRLLDFILEHILAAGGVSGVVGGRAAEATCLVAGVTGELASGLSRGLSRSGVERERILFCDYF